MALLAEVKKAEKAKAELLLARQKQRRRVYLLVGGSVTILSLGYAYVKLR